MTNIDSADLNGRTCPICGLVRGNMIRHADWHRRTDAESDAQNAALEHVRNLLVALEGELHERERS